MTDRWQKEAAKIVFEFESRIQAGEFDANPEAYTASATLKFMIGTALSAAHEAGRREERERSANMHRRAQKAEGKLMRMEAAHADACEYAFRTHIDYTLYGSLLLNMNQSLFPKLTPAAIRIREVKP